MRKHSIVLLFYSIMAVLYIVLSLILTTDRNTVFWIGFSMVLFAVVLVSSITIASNRKQSSAFPVDISIIVFSAIYVNIVIAINVLLGLVFKTTVSVFAGVHLICTALYGIIAALMFATKKVVIKQNNQVNGKICEMQTIIYEFEKIKTKLIDMNFETRKKALPLMDSLIDELRFSDFGINVDVSDMDTRLYSMANTLLTEVDNLIFIESDDISSMETTINDIKKVIKDRNMQIKLMSSSI